MRISFYVNTIHTCIWQSKRPVPFKTESQWFFLQCWKNLSIFILQLLVLFGSHSLYEGPEPGVYKSFKIKSMSEKDENICWPNTISLFCGWGTREKASKPLDRAYISSKQLDFFMTKYIQSNCCSKVLFVFRRESSVMPRHQVTRYSMTSGFWPRVRARSLRAPVFWGS